MKDKQKVVFAVICVMVLQTSIILAPTAHAMQMLITGPKEQLRMQIEDGFGAYLREQNLKIETRKSLETAFQAFLRANPKFQMYLAEYTNLTKA